MMRPLRFSPAVFTFLLVMPCGPALGHPLRVSLHRSAEKSDLAVDLVQNEAFANGLGIAVAFDGRRLAFQGFDSLALDSGFAFSSAPEPDLYDVDGGPATNLLVQWQGLRITAVGAPVTLQVIQGRDDSGGRNLQFRQSGTGTIDVLSTLPGAPNSKKGGAQ